MNPTVSSLRELANAAMELYRWNQKMIKAHGDAVAQKYLADLEPSGWIIWKFLYQTQRKNLQDRPADEAFVKSALTMTQKPESWGNQPYSPVTSYAQLRIAADFQRVAAAQLLSAGWKLKPDEATTTRIHIKHVDDAAGSLPAVSAPVPQYRAAQQQQQLIAGASGAIGNVDTSNKWPVILSLTLIAGACIGGYFIVKKYNHRQPAPANGPMMDRRAFAKKMVGKD